MNNLDIFTFITRNSADYAELLRKSCEKLKSGKMQIRYKCVESLGADRLPEGWECIGSVKEDLGHNCSNHANAMHYAMDYLNERLYSHGVASTTIFMDADMCMLYEGWDRVVFNEVNRRSIFGTAFGDKALQYHKFPNVFFFAFRKKVLEKVAFNFHPLLKDGKESPVRYKIESRQEACAFQRRIGDIIKCDTGYSLPLTVYKAGIKSNYMPRVTGFEAGTQLPFRNDIQRSFCKQKPDHMAEWHYKGKLFVCHKQASRNHSLGGEWGKIWMDRVNIFTLENYGWKL